MPPERTTVRLLGTFELAIHDQPVAVPIASARVLAFVLLRRRVVPRNYVSRVLWPDSTESRASANLRTALWRLSRAGAPLVRDEQHRLHVDNRVWCDLDDFEARANRILDGHVGDGDGGSDELDRRRFEADLLPDWDEPWLRAEQERVRHLRLAVLERVSAELLARGRPVEALDAAMSAYAEDPLRETATRAVIECHLFSGNRGEARRHFERYHGDLRAAFGLTPSPALDELMATTGLRGRGGDAPRPA